MAKITVLPAQTIIDGFKGKIDYYLWMGIPCVRSWPRSPGPHRTPAVEEQWTPFAFAGSYWNSLDIEVKEAWNATAAGFAVTGRDLFTKSYINGSLVSFTP